MSFLCTDAPPVCTSDAALAAKTWENVERLLLESVIDFLVYSFKVHDTIFTRLLSRSSKHDTITLKSEFRPHATVNVTHCFIHFVISGFHFSDVTFSAFEWKPCPLFQFIHSLLSRYGYSINIIKATAIIFNKNNMIDWLEHLGLLEDQFFVWALLP